MQNNMEQVIILQDKLKQLGYYDQSITGSFDKYTKNTVKDFQEKNSFPVTGEVSDDMWESLLNFNDNEFNMLPYTLNNRPVLRPGSTGDDVRKLQQLLTDLLYYNGSVDGNFGQQTTEAVKSFQFNNKLTPDGIVGRDTWSALISLYSPLAICANGGETGSQYIDYTVKAGDTLWLIANRYDTTVNAIKVLNNLTSDIINIGQVLKIPVSNNGVSSSISYTVQKGDSLWSIANKYNTTVTAIKKANNLTGNIIYIGQVLKIPTTSNGEISTMTYIVKAGDTLFKIAQRYNTTVEVIKSLNNLSSDNLIIGQKLLLPTYN